MAVPEWTRRRTQANHTGTHLLHAALRKVLGDIGAADGLARRAGPAALRLRGAPAPTTPEQIAEIERLVNEEILRDQPGHQGDHGDGRGAPQGRRHVLRREVRRARARRRRCPGFSTELCGGCHVPRTGEIGAFKIVSDRGLAAGVRRLEAVTSLGAVELLSQDEQILNALSGAAQAPREGLAARWDEREERVRALEREVASLKLKLASGDAGVAGRPDRGGRRAAS